MQVINTSKAPEAIGTYNQAICVGKTVYLSGQIGLEPLSMTLREGFLAQLEQVFDNLAAVCEASGGNLQQIAKLTIYLTDLSQFDAVNTMMAEKFAKPYPARAAIEVSALPKGALVEMDGVMVLD